MNIIYTRAQLQAAKGNNPKTIIKCSNEHYRYFNLSKKELTIGRSLYLSFQFHANLERGVFCGYATELSKQLNLQATSWESGYC